jgi:hypothetical protein
MTHATHTDKISPCKMAVFMAHCYFSNAVEISSYDHYGICHNSTRKVDTFLTALLNTVLIKLHRSYKLQILSHLTWGTLRHRKSKYCSLGFRITHCQNRELRVFATNIFVYSSERDILILPSKHFN